ncbi:MAG: carbohydrate ABC transporter permease [Chloroflexota bacterium]|nr:MAG: carbohydrate ABC transporter permease [Chloroflexota bacterium]
MTARTGGFVRPLVLYGILIVASIAFMIPFVFAVGTSLKPFHLLHVFPPLLLPPLDEAQFSNYWRIFNVPYVPFTSFYVNTVIITLASMLGAVLTGTASAYGFARFRWPGRDFFFGVLLATLVLPEEVVIIPKFLMFHLIPDALFGKTWIDTWWPLIVPSWFGGGAFAVFLLRQFFMQIPRELDEAAVIDGANTWDIFWSIIIPLSKPALATVAIFSFLGHWNDFIHPLIYLNSTEMFPLSVGLRWFQQQPTDPIEPRENLLMAASVLMITPALLIFFSMQRYFVRGIVMTGIKG